MAPHPHRPEVTARVDLAAEAGHALGRARRAVVLARIDRLVVLLHVHEEPVAVGQEDVLRLDDRQRTAVPQEACRLLEPELRIDPMEGRERDNRVEAALVRLPRLEVRVDDLDAGKFGEVALRRLSQPGPELDGDEPEAAPRQWQRRLPGPGADLEDAAARGKPRQLDEIVEHAFGINRPGPVVELRDLLEGPSKLFPATWRGQPSLARRPPRRRWDP